MQWLMRGVCIGYFVFLTLLLLTSDPSRLIFVHGPLPWLLQALLPVAHVVSFLVLAVLALTPRWPVPRWMVVAFLACYGGMTEIIQGFVPRRTPEWADWFQDLGGIVAGTALCWAVAAVFGLLMRNRGRQELLTPPLSEEWETLRKVVQTTASDKESWWN
jgi:hypothetical protein